MKNVIVQVVQHLRPGGIETMALDLMQQLQKEAEVHIVSLEGSAEHAVAHWPRLKPLSSQLHFLNKSAGFSASLIWQLRNLLKRLSATAVHSHHIGPLVYGGCAARLAGIRTHLHTEHDAWHLSQRRHAQLQRIFIRALQPIVIADCNAVAEALQGHVPNCTPFIILNGVDTERFIPASTEHKSQLRKQLGLPENQLIVGCAARLEAIKGHTYLLQALSRTYNATLLLAGEGSLRDSLESQVQQLGLKNRVRFLGALDDVVPFYQVLDLFCLPSLNEGLPLSPLEAQACGVPVVVSDVGGCRSIVCPQTGRIIPSRNVDAIRLVILYHQYIKTSVNPRPFVLQQGNLKKTAKAYFNLIRHTAMETCNEHISS